MHRSTRFIVAASTVSLFLAGALSASAMEVDCSSELEPIPRDGSTVNTSNLWLSYSGSINYTEVSDAEKGMLSGVEPGPAVLTKRASSHVALEVNLDEPGEYEWKIADGPQVSFTLSDDAEVDDTPPTMSDGEVSAELELLVYDEFPVIFRDWTVTFPTGDDDRTDAENMRYLLEFSWEDAEEGQESATILVTPSMDEAGGESVAVRLGGRTDRCRHEEPQVGLTEDVEIAVRAVDLAGNVSEEAVTGTFGGASAEEFADAHDELQRVIEELRQRSIEERERKRAEEEAAQKAQEEAEEGGCSAVGGGGPGWAVLAALVLLGVMRRRQ